METNLTLNHTLYVFAARNHSEHGDPLTSMNLSDATQVPCLAEQTDGFSGALQDDDTGTISVHIAPDTPLYVAANSRITGLVCAFNRFAEPTATDFYRIDSVVPGESLVDGEPDLVQVTLQRIERPGTA